MKILLMINIKILVFQKYFYKNPHSHSFSMRLYLCVLLYALQCLATQTKRKYQDISVDDFAREQMNSLGGTISYGEMRHGLSPSMPAVKLEPTSTDAIYTTQLAPFGECFDASNHDVRFFIDFLIISSLKLSL